MRPGTSSLLFTIAVFIGSNSLATPAQVQAQVKAPPHKLLSQASAIATKVAALRALPLLRPILRGVMNKAEIKARILKIMKQEYTPAELDAEALGLKRFGLLPNATNYRTMMVNLLTDQIAGFYDHREKKLYIASWMQSGSDMVMAHEIDHALQDQHFDLETFMDLDRREGDALSARQALIEGDAIALMLEYQLASVNQPPPWGNAMIMAVIGKSMTMGSGAMPGIPFVIREGLLFPYTAGLNFVAHFRKHHPWSKIDAIYKKPPLSTEQIIHPDKYTSYEQPHRVTAAVPKATLRGFKEIVSTVHGEQGLELFLRAHGVSQMKASVAAAGWGGDRMAVYAPISHKGSTPQGTVGVILSSWDTENDAMEFYEALEHALPNWSGSPKSSVAGQLQFVYGADRITAE
ncbi:MAG: hypothetical protein JKY56_06490, partial [Kofleriaceae bacterium]|nr:hypothetical protein [Kofleriaceae bacterium]